MRINAEPHRAQVQLDPSKPRGLPRGSDGEIRSGFEFYMKSGKNLHFITIEIRSDPVLTAVTEEQLHVWKDVVALPARFLFKNGLWNILSQDGV